jgi:ABC-type antimicrobial peptide transport system permease subunit
MLSYAFKRVIRSWKLFVALLLGTVLAATFFAGINIAADTAARQALDQRLSEVPVDVVVSVGSELKPGQTSDVIGRPSNIIKEAADAIRSVDDVKSVEVTSSFWNEIQLPESNETAYFALTGISNGSHVYDGLTVISGNGSLLENEAYVWADSPEASKLKIGSILQVKFPIWINGHEGEPPSEVTLTLNLTVAGFIQLEGKALSIATGQYYYYSYPFLVTTSTATRRGEYAFSGNLLILSWEKTLAEFLDVLYNSTASYWINTYILAYLDREQLINPWDISGSINRVSAITIRINDKIRAYGLYATNNLENILTGYQFIVSNMRLTFIINAVPVFFVAWYMGMTVSDVSLNLRRREIGLLLTKGFSRSQLLRMFLGEATIIGLLSGGVGVALSLLLNPLFVKLSGSEFSGAAVIGPDTIILVLIFSVGITFLSVFQPARKASSLNAVEALTEYRYVEEVKPYRKKLPWIAFILGTYKIIMFLLGINLATIMMGPMPTANIIVLILLGIWLFFDVYVLTYIGPLLFFWGFTKIFIRGSLKFQELTTKIASFLGDLGSLATRNIQRNPARAASIAFLIALIIGYSIQANGALATEQDYIVRKNYFEVGADVSVYLGSVTNASAIVNEIQNNLSDVISSTAVEYEFWGVSSLTSMSLKAVNPEEWIKTAYYESEWFTGKDVKSAFQSLASDNHTIILERGIAKALELDVEDTITLTFGESSSCRLRVVGFFGIEAPPTFGVRIPEEYLWSQYWSYVPEGLYRELSDNVSASVKLLIKLKAGADGVAAADRIWELESDRSLGVIGVDSVADRLQERQTDISIIGPMNVQRLGVFFAVLAASVGTALVTFVSLKERSKEVSIMSVRGLSFRQLATMLLVENLAVVVFSVLLGAVVGLIIVRGNVAAANTFAYSLVAKRMVFPLDSILTIIACFALVFVSTIIPIIIMARRYVSRLERMVR